MTAVFDELFFGGTRILFIDGRPLHHLSAGIYTGANAQGIMGAGLPAEIRRMAGAEVERELRRHGSLLVGEAYLTGPGLLVERGVTAIAHGVVTSRPGESATLEHSIEALLAGLRLLEDAGCRSVTVPQIGWRVADLDPTVAAAELGRVIVTHLRRRSRLGTVLIVSTDRDYLKATAASCRRFDAVPRDAAADGRSG